MKKIVIAAAFGGLVLAVTGCVNQRDHEALRLLIVGVEAEIRRLHAPTKQLEIPGSK